MRIIKLANQFKQFNQLFDAMRNTMKDISNIIILIFILVFTYALLGLEIYAFRVHEIGQGDSYPESNFNTLV